MTTAASPEATGGAGYTFEDGVVANFLVSLLCDGAVRGLPEAICRRVLVQRAALGHPLDDVVVSAHDRSHADLTLSLQVKQSLTISAAPSNTDFRDLVVRANRTVTGTAFVADRDRVGAAVAHVASDKLRAVRSVFEMARLSADAADFAARLAMPGLSSDDQRGFVAAVREILGTELGRSPSQDELRHLLRHFVLMRFDLRTEGAEGDHAAIERLRVALRPEAAHRATDLWRALLDLARRMAGAAGSMDRPALLARLSPEFELQAARRYAGDLVRIADAATHALQDIDLTLDGVAVERPALVEQIDDALQASRYVEIQGPPGSGKSALLRHCAECSAERGFVLVLKSDRIVGPGWAGLAQHWRLETDRLHDLLVELAAMGEPMLFIDGIDRLVDRGQRQIVLDIAREIVRDPALAAWRIVASCRDNNTEHVRTWLQTEISALGIAQVRVGAFSDDEAAVLADRRPALRPLLFGAPAVRELARRPFFLSMLARLRAATAPGSEVELATLWWERGGYDAEHIDARLRQQVLLAFARSGLCSFGRELSVAGLDPGAIDGLVADGVLREPLKGVSVAFSHDILLEWAAFALLRAVGTNWLGVVRDAGEPAHLGRPVELLAQSVIETGGPWLATLESLEQSDARSQWNRCWLLAPLASPRFAEFESSYFAALTARVEGRFDKLIVWARAARTTENALVVAGHLGGGDLDALQRMRLADAWAWPADYAFWQRLLAMLLRRADDIPIALIHDALDSFGIWLNVFTQVPSKLTEAIAVRAHRWLLEIEDENHPDDYRAIGRGRIWADFHGHMDELEHKARFILFRAATQAPDLLASYLDRLIAEDRYRRTALADVLGWSPFIAKSAPVKVVDLVLASMLDKLPEARDRERDGMFGWQPHDLDWHAPGVREYNGEFHPASPIREPFKSLFESAPAEALRLVRALCNHSMEAWRQLHRLTRRDAPLPLRLEFPWGQEEFWGNAQTYGWFRGVGGANVVESALMALDAWAFAEVERGRPVDAVIEDVVRDNSCIAVIGIAAAIAMDRRHISAATLPIATSQRIWGYDLQRVVALEHTATNTIGFWLGTSREHLAAIQASNARAIRKLHVRDSLAFLFLVAAPPELFAAYAARIRSFPDQLPFEYASEHQSEPIVAHLRRLAELALPLAERQHVTFAPHENGGTLIGFDDPNASAPDVRQAVEASVETGRWATPLNWAIRCFKSGKLDDTMTPGDAIRAAQANDLTDLFDHDGSEPELMRLRQEGVAAAAAAALVFAVDVDDEVRGWCEGVMRRAALTPLGEHFAVTRKMLAPWHPALMAARGLGSMIRSGRAVAAERELLLALCGYHLDAVAGEALAQAMQCWRVDERLAWTAFDLGLRLSIGHVDAADEDYRADSRAAAETAHVTLVARAKELLKDTAAPIDLPAMPPAWVLAPPRRSWRGETAEPHWREPDTYLRWDVAPIVLNALPLDFAFSAEERRGPILHLVDTLVAWTIDRFAPTWAAARDRDRIDGPYEWGSAFLNWLGGFAARLTPADVDQRYVTPLLARQGRRRERLIDAFTTHYICAALVDTEVVDPGVIPLMIRIIDGIAEDGDWDYARHRPSGGLPHELSSIVRIMLMTAWEQPASGAKRFANRDWSEVAMLMPVADTMIRHLGDVPAVLAEWLSLVELSRAHYPLPDLLRQLALIPSSSWSSRIGWTGNDNAARIAAMLQSHCERQRPRSPEVRSQILAQLDHLVDVGDRRSVALQISEWLR